MKKELLKKILYFYTIGVNIQAISKLTGAPVDTILKCTHGHKRKEKLNVNDKLELLSLLQRLEKRYSSSLKREY